MIFIRFIIDIFLLLENFASFLIIRLVDFSFLLFSLLVFQFLVFVCFYTFFLYFKILFFNLGIVFAIMKFIFSSFQILIYIFRLKIMLNSLFSKILTKFYSKSSKGEDREQYLAFCEI